MASAELRSYRQETYKLGLSDSEKDIWGLESRLPLGDGRILEVSQRQLGSSCAGTGIDEQNRVFHGAEDEGKEKRDTERNEEKTDILNVSGVMHF